MKIEITVEELQLVIESLTYSKQKIENYELYPNDEFKKGRIESVEKLIKKLKEKEKINF